MNEQPTRGRMGSAPFCGESTRRGGAVSPTLFDSRLRVGRWLAGLLAAMFWLMLVDGLPLQSLRADRGRERTELACLLKAEAPDATAIVGAFDDATEESGDYGTAFSVR